MAELSESVTIPSHSISRRTLRRIVIVFSVLILVLVFHLHRRWSAVARLQYSLNRNYEVDFNQVPRRPRSMPGYLDRWTFQILKKMEGRGMLGPSNNLEALQTRVYSLFHGSIRSIEIIFPEKVSRDFGPSLEQFGRLEYLLIDDPGFDSDAYRSGTSEILNSLSKLKQLKKLYLGCFHLEESHLEQIAQLPSLEVLLLEKVDLPANFVETLSKSATLSELHADGSITADPRQTNIDPFLSPGFESVTGASDRLAAPDPFPLAAPDPFRSKSTQWRSSEVERQLLKKAGIKLVE